jgi:hypothetical protein
MAHGGDNVVNGITDELEASRPGALDDLQILLQRCQQGDREALPQLRAVLDQHPEIWRHIGDLALHAELAWVDLICGTNDSMRESVTRKVRELKVELGGASPSPLERLLAERVSACWLQLHHADTSFARAKGLSLKQADAALKRQDQAHRRYLTAIGALATLKKLMPSSATSTGPLDGASSISGCGADVEVIGQGIPGPDSSSVPEGPLRLAQCDGSIEIGPLKSERSVESERSRRSG